MVGLGPSGLFRVFSVALGWATAPGITARGVTAPGVVGVVPLSLFSSLRVCSPSLICLSIGGAVGRVFLALFRVKQ